MIQAYLGFQGFEKSYDNAINCYQEVWNLALQQTVWHKTVFGASLDVFDPKSLKWKKNVRKWGH